MCANAAIRLVNNGREVETTQMPINGCMDKQMWYVHKTKYYSAIKKERSTDSCYNVDEPWKHAKWKKPESEGHMDNTVHDSISVQNRQIHIVVAMSGGQRIGSECKWVCGLFWGQ